MIEADRVLLLAGIAVVLLGLSSRIVKRHALSPVLLALVAGVLAGPQALGLIDPTAAVPRGELLEQLSRLALAFAVFAGLVAPMTPTTTPRDIARLLGQRHGHIKPGAPTPATRQPGGSPWPG